MKKARKSKKSATVTERQREVKRLRTLRRKAKQKALVRHKTRHLGVRVKHLNKLLEGTRKEMQVIAKDLMDSKAKVKELTNKYEPKVDTPPIEESK